MAEIQGCILRRYLQDASLTGPFEFLGFPTSSEVDLSGGAYNTFQGTSCSAPNYPGSGSGLYWNASAQNTYFVRGCIYQFYQALRGLTSGLGFPTSDEISLPNATWESLFQNGCIFYDGPSQQFSVFSNPTEC